MQDERVRNHINLPDVCLWCIRHLVTEQSSFQLGWQRGAALPTAASRASAPSSQPWAWWLRGRMGRMWLGMAAGLVKAKPL